MAVKVDVKMLLKFYKCDFMLYLVLIKLYLQGLDVFSGIQVITPSWHNNLGMLPRSKSWLTWLGLD